MLIELSDEEVELILRAVKTDKNFCERTLIHTILPEYREKVRERIWKYGCLVDRLSGPAEKSS